MKIRCLKTILSGDFFPRKMWPKIDNVLSEILIIAAFRPENIFVVEVWPLK